MRGFFLDNINPSINLFSFTLKKANSRFRMPTFAPNATREDIIKHYFLSGFSYNEIVQFLDSVHGITLSLRQLNRLLRKMGLFRRHNHVSPNTTLQAVRDVLKGSCSGFGYRQMHQKLRADGVNVSRESVRFALQALDPEGVDQRTNHRFNRRKYVSKGPNYLWHIDGYDKLKPFGLAIHGAIDGYSRRILWLEVGPTNNNPKIIASYFLHTIKELQLIPRCIRADRGSENILIGGMQRFFRRHHTDGVAGIASFRYGPSTRNQRIESWWSIFRRSTSNWWINFFKDLCDTSIFDPSLSYHVDCLRFCFTGLLQTDLDHTRRLWNNHRIRKTKNAESPPGRPAILYFTPQLSDGEDCKFPINNSDVILAGEHSEQSSLFGCTEGMAEFADIVMREHGLETPRCAEEAKNLFLCLIQEVDAIV